MITTGTTETLTIFAKSEAGMEGSLNQHLRSVRAIVNGQRARK
jgi:hypothetical protein